jgi:hypothetical protein
VESRVQVVDRYATYTFTNGAENIGLKTLLLESGVSAANPQESQTCIITELISDLWKLSLMLALKCLFLSGGIYSY